METKKFKVESIGGIFIVTEKKTDYVRIIDSKNIIRKKKKLSKTKKT